MLLCQNVSYVPHSELLDNYLNFLLDPDERVTRREKEEYFLLLKNKKSC